MGGVRRMFDWITNAADYVRIYGYGQGLGAYVRNEHRLHSAKGNSRVPLRLPLIREPFEVRARTSDLEVLQQVFVERQYRRKYAVPPPPLIIDCGANIGLSTIYFANEYPGAAIYAIEPSPENFELLAANVRRYPRITPIQAAVWSSEGQVALTNPQGEYFSFRTAPRTAGDASQSVRSVTISQVLAESGFPRIGLLKIDIEGAEKELFDENCHEWLSRTDTLMIELHDRFVPGSTQAVYSALLRYVFSQELAGESIIVEFDHAGATPGREVAKTAAVSS